MQIMKKQHSSEPAAARPAAKIPVEFVLDMPPALSVVVAGNFNNWDASQTPLRKADRGIWRVTVPLAAGRYEYRFVADGQWLADPSATESAPNPFGGQNSIKVVEPPVSLGGPLLLAPPPTSGPKGSRVR